VDRSARAKKIRNSIDLGVSFSVKTCNDYGLDWRATLTALLDSGIQRFRIMSYWDLHEPTQSQYDFSLLDEQLGMVSSRGGRVSLCIGMRQPRWPETHLPSWALDTDIEQRTAAYLAYHQLVIDRYKSVDYIESWQLENEFWNKNFGENNTFSRARLKTEFRMIREADPEKPIIMSLANTYGYPIFGPKPDLFGTTMYLTQFEKGRYTKTRLSPLYFQLRKFLVKVTSFRGLIIHELQGEPWGPKANWEMDDAEQSKSMNSDQLKKCIEFARDSGMKYADLWGAEWWYWRKTKSKDVALWAVVQSEVSSSKAVIANTK